MTAIADRPGRSGRIPSPENTVALSALTVFASAALVFMVEPMMARLLLPLLGGSAAVWNTSLAFFQIALLGGYIYAHLLQRIRRISVQMGVHIAALLAACLCLPLHVTGIFGAPSSHAPAVWLLSVLAVSLGLPFAALSATAPLVQAWYARAAHQEDAGEPYALYAASNTGSLIALIAYPVLVEPNIGLHAQTTIWSAGFTTFIAVIACLGLVIRRSVQSAEIADRAVFIASTAETGTVRERLVWLALAAAPSSLMLGVTNYITTDLGSAPFLWVAPLAIYLCTFIIAFSKNQIIRPRTVLALQAPIVTICALVFWIPAFLSELGLHLVCFFVTALVCHQALVARRPATARLTEFYVWISIGGVAGGAFNAFVAPMVFNRVIEYPAVFILACLARPWGRGRPSLLQWLAVTVGSGSAIAAVLLVSRGQPDATTHMIAFAGLSLTAVCALLLWNRAIAFMAAIFALVVGGNLVFDSSVVMQHWRDFFGVLSVSRETVPGLGEVKSLRHGVTLHGAQSSLPEYRCRPLTYYGPETPIGQVFTAMQSRKPAINVGAVGLGAGSVAAYTRPGDAMRFFEIDPLVIQVATNPAYFTYTTGCAKGRIDYSLGDARMTLSNQPSRNYDILLIDAFSSDSVPAHLLTVEALRMYLSKLTPGGVLILHLSNRNLDLMRPAMATASAAGAYAIQQTHITATNQTKANLWTSSEQAVLLAPSRAALEPFMSDRRWKASDANGVQPWTDDYTDIFGALVRHGREHMNAAR
jgi:hypothetical protein